MSKTVIDGLIKDWGDRLYYEPVKARKGNNMRGGKSSAQELPATRSHKKTEGALIRTIQKHPEVMLKISGGGKNMAHIKAHMDYISRNGLVEIEDENGQLHLGKEAVRDVRESWAKGKIGIPFTGERRKEAFNIVLSMPPGTDRPSVTNAARQFALAAFSKHQYVFATHEDEKHPHVHLSVKATGGDGVRLNPRKAQLQEWRELFAEKLREEGIAANATPRRARGVVLKATKQAVLHMEHEYQLGNRPEPSKVSVLKQQKVAADLEAGPKASNTGDQLSITTRGVLATYGDIAKALSSGDDKSRQVALEIVSFVKAMPVATAKLKPKELDSQQRRPNVETPVLRDLQLKDRDR